MRNFRRHITRLTKNKKQEAKAGPMVSKSVQLTLYHCKLLLLFSVVLVEGGVRWNYLQGKTNPDQWSESYALLVKWLGSMATLTAGQHVKCEWG